MGHSLDPKGRLRAAGDRSRTEAGPRLHRRRCRRGAESSSSTDAKKASDELTFGDASLEGGYFIGPTLFDHVTTEMSIYHRRDLWPVLCIVRARDYEEALALPWSTNTETA